MLEGIIMGDKVKRVRPMVMTRWWEERMMRLALRLVISRWGLLGVEEGGYRLGSY